jgi:chromosome segregation ATPase
MNMLIESTRVLGFTLVSLVLALTLAPSDAAAAETPTKASCDSGYNGNVQSVNNEYDSQLRHMQERAAHLLAQGNAARDQQTKRQLSHERDEALSRYDQLKAAKAARLSQAKAAHEHCLNQVAEAERKAKIALERTRAHEKYRRELAEAKRELGGQITEVTNRLKELQQKQDALKHELQALTPQQQQAAQHRQQLQQHLATKEAELKEELDTTLAKLK